MNDHPYSDPSRWPIDKRGLAAVRTYFEALALMHRCRGREIELQQLPATTAREVVHRAWGDALSPALARPA